MSSPKKKRVAVVVLGDIGRSPRMQYHSLSLANQGNFDVDVVGFQGTDPCPDLVLNPNIHIHAATPFTPFSLQSRFLFLIYAPIKIVFQIIQLFWLLFSIQKPDLMLVQSPPAIPTFLVVLIVCWLRGAKLIIDWHNFGFTLLRISANKGLLPLVWLHEQYEKVLGRFADGHLTVTEEMKRVLETEWRFKTIQVAYDRPPSFFRPLSLEEKHQFFSSNPVFAPSNRSPNETLFTIQSSADSQPILKKERPFLLVSSTSWTPDEDFQLLFDALLEIEGKAMVAPQFPDVLAIITGRGPLKAHYESKIRAMEFQKVKIVTAWLEAADYPKLLGAADLGVSLHNSSSGFDLPMKVVDMFGCQLPVFAHNYKCISELVLDGDNGLLFSSSHELAQQLYSVISTFPHDGHKLRHFQRNLNFPPWDENWEKTVLPHITSIIS